MRRAPLAVLLLLFAGPARAQPAPDCARTYTQAFTALHEAAGGLRLKVDGATEEVTRIFRERPARCEPGAYAAYLGEVMRFTRRALRSGATPQTPKEGWVRGAQAAMGFAPLTVPQAEYYDDLQLYQQAKGELIGLIAEAGAGPAPSALLLALSESVPRAGAYGPTPQLLVPKEPPPEVEPAPSPLVPEPPRAPPAEVGGGLADTYVARAGALFKAGKHVESAEELRKAYLVRPKVLYLFNMAQAYRLGSRPREALALYREFLDKEPQSPLRAEAKGYVRDMEALLAEQERAEQAKRALRTEQGRVAAVQIDLRAERARAERAERERLDAERKLTEALETLEDARRRARWAAGQVGEAALNNLPAWALNTRLALRGLAAVLLGELPMPGKERT
jgi:tetratricopeptide (TPR) repeat protein